MKILCRLVNTYRIYQISLALLFFGVIFSCSNPKEKESVVKNSELKLVNLDLIIFGLSDKIKYDLFIKSPTKVITQEDELILKGDTVKFNFEIYSKSEIEVNVKTFDSFGPDVFLMIYLDGKVWYTEKSNYQIELNTTLP